MPTVATDAGYSDQHVEWVNSFNLVGTELAAAYPDDYAGSEMNFDQATGWFAFKGEIPAGAAAIIGSLAGTELRAGYGYSAREVGEKVAEIASAAHAESGEHGAAVAYQEGNEPIIRVEVTTDAGTESGISAARATATVSDELLNRVQDSAESIVGPLEFAVEVAAMDQSASVLEHTAGGKLVGENGDNRWCSTAFPIKRNTGPEIGVLTAGHCPGMGKYNTTPSAFYSPFPNSQRTEYEFYNGGDFRWNHSKTMFNGRTWVGFDARVINKVADAGIGTKICKFGHSTDASCGHEVRYANLAYSMWIPEGNNTYKVGPLRGVENHVTAPGDSGGPWFFGNTAYGIHSGAPGGHSAWSDASNALARLGVALWVG